MHGKSTDTALDTHKVRVTGFSDQYAKTKKVGILTLPELRDRILAARASTKARLPWLKLASFGDKRPPPDPDTGEISDCLRWDGNVAAIEGIELDYDSRLIGGKAVSFDEAVEIVKRMGSRCLIYGSPSNTLAAPRWRLLLPLSKSEQRTEMRRKFAARVNGFFGSIFASESFSLSQSYYYGRADDNPDADHRAVIIDGKFIDLQDVLYKYEAAGMPKDDEPDWEGVGGQHSSGRGFDNILAELGDGPGLNGFHDVLCAAVASYVVTNQNDLDKEKLKGILRDAVAKAPKKNSKQRAADIKRYNSDKFLNGLIKSAVRKYTKQPTTSATGLPIIYISAGKEKANAERAQRILIAAGAEIYQRSGRLVRPIVEETDASDGRKTKTARLREVTADFLNVELNALIEFKKFNEREKDWVRVRDRNVTIDVMSQEGRWLFPKIIGVITTPTMRPGGTLLLTPGYDEATRLLLVAPPDMPDIPDHPTRDHALAGLQLLKDDLLDECAFVDGISRAVALSALITPVVRGAFAITPAHCVRAAEMGSGKSYLCDISAAIATGDLMPVMSVSENDDAETEKRLCAALSSGQPLVSLDNVNGQLGGNFLCQAIERTILEIRPFGKNTETIRVEARGTSIFMTGNNITLVGDVGRRVITATLDPKLERPELREFKKNPVEIIKANRGKYIAACLTICRAYVVAGRPQAAPPLLSFKGWSDTVRSALRWLGEADCVDSTKSTREEDPKRLRRLEMMTAWLDVVKGFGENHGRTIAAMIKLAKKTVATYDTTLQHPDLLDAFITIAGKRNDIGEPIIDAGAAGNWFRDNKNVVVRNMRFVNKLNDKRGSRWWVEHLGGEASEQQYWEERKAERAGEQDGQQGTEQQEQAGSEVPF